MKTGHGSLQRDVRGFPGDSLQERVGPKPEKGLDCGQAQSRDDMRCCLREAVVVGSIAVVPSTNSGRVRFGQPAHLCIWDLLVASTVWCGSSLIRPDKGVKRLNLGVFPFVPHETGH
jgi:hypothetical protein